MGPRISGGHGGPAGPRVLDKQGVQNGPGVSGGSRGFRLTGVKKGPTRRFNGSRQEVTGCAALDRGRTVQRSASN